MKKAQISIYLVIGVIIVLLTAVIIINPFKNKKEIKSGFGSEKPEIESFTKKAYQDSTECLITKLGSNGGEISFNNIYPSKKLSEYSGFIENTVELGLKNFTVFQGKNIIQQIPKVSIQENLNDVSGEVIHKVINEKQRRTEYYAKFSIESNYDYKTPRELRDKIKKEHFPQDSSFILGEPLSEFENPARIYNVK